MTSLEIARDVGAAGNAVFVHSGADANDVWFPVQRPDLGVSPGLRAAGRAALMAAGVGIDDVGVFDLYSCFPCVIEMACEALGIGGELARQHFDGDVAPEPRVARTVDLAHRAGPDQCEDLV